MEKDCDKKEIFFPKDLPRHEGDCEIVSISCFRCGQPSYKCWKCPHYDVCARCQDKEHKIKNLNSASNLTGTLV